MMIKSIERSCLACGCSDFEVVHQNQLATLDGIDLSSRIGLCSECGQLQAHCLAAPTQYDNYYQRLSKTDFSETLSALDEARICEPPLHLAQHPEATVVISSYRSQESLAKSLAQSWPNAICRLYPYPEVRPKNPAEAETADASA